MTVALRFVRLIRIRLTRRVGPCTREQQRGRRGAAGGSGGRGGGAAPGAAVGRGPLCFCARDLRAMRTEEYENFQDFLLKKEELLEGAGL